jgi:hypothetical protein
LEATRRPTGPILREVTHVAIIRITKEQIEEAKKARDAALLKDDDFRRYDEQLQSLGREAAKVREKEPS